MEKLAIFSEQLNSFNRVNQQVVVETTDGQAVVESCYGVLQMISRNPSLNAAMHGNIMEKVQNLELQGKLQSTYIDAL